jgi:hypothetical protein
LHELVCKDSADFFQALSQYTHLEGIRVLVVQVGEKRGVELRSCKADLALMTRAVVNKVNVLFAFNIKQSWEADALIAHGLEMSFTT